MSIQFKRPMDKETTEALEKFLGENIAVMDDKNVLVENLSEAHQKEMSNIVKTTRQPAAINIHDEDDIVEMSDGTKYQVTKKGWKKNNEGLI